MPAKHSRASAPLSDAEFAALADLLDEHGAFDTDGLLGVLSAVGVAPSLVPPSAWIPVVMSDGFSGLGAEGAEDFFGLVLRLYNEVLEGLKTHQPMMPEADDVPGCKLFAAGFVAGAELDPEWIGDADRWTFASWAGYLGGRLDVLPRATRATFDEHPEEATATLCRDMGAIVLDAHAYFLKIRRATAAQAPPSSATSSARSARVGRNDPCPCGSGKKYKRCCIEAGTPTAG
jgi:uncharacterized protein